MMWNLMDVMSVVDQNVTVTRPQNHDGYLIHGVLWDGGPESAVFVPGSQVIRQRTRENLKALVKAKIQMAELSFKEDYPDGIPEDISDQLYVHGEALKLV